MVVPIYQGDADSLRRGYITSIPPLESLESRSPYTHGYQLFRKSSVIAIVDSVSFSSCLGHQAKSYAVREVLTVLGAIPAADHKRVVAMGNHKMRELNSQFTSCLAIFSLLFASLAGGGQMESLGAVTDAMSNCFTIVRDSSLDPYPTRLDAEWLAFATDSQPVYEYTPTPVTKQRGFMCLRT